MDEVVKTLNPSQIASAVATFIIGVIVVCAVMALAYWVTHKA